MIGILALGWDGLDRVLGWFDGDLRFLQYITLDELWMYAPGLWSFGMGTKAGGTAAGVWEVECSGFDIRIYVLGCLSWDCVSVVLWTVKGICRCV